MTKLQDTSYTFAIAKVAAILTIFTGHYFGGALWVPATVALFVMAWSSGFFTALKYAGNFDLARFWRAKIDRLGYRLLVIDVFLLVLFLWQRKNGIWTWQTVLALPGLNGFLNWFQVPNPGPFGAGLWFLTLLWLFYLLYPVLERINRKRTPASVFIVSALIVSMVLYHLSRLDYMLWMTIFAFLFGVFSARYRIRVRPLWALVIIAASAGLLVEHNMLVYVKYPDYRLANYALILTGSVAAVYLLLEIQLPRAWFERFLPWSGCVMEFYVIHFYLSGRFNGWPSLVSYILSMLITATLAWMLNKIHYRVKGIVVWQAALLRQM